MNPVAAARTIQVAIQRSLEFRRMQTVYGGQVVDGEGRFRERQAGDNLWATGPVPAIATLRAGIAGDRKLWDRATLTFDEQTHDRQKPFRFLRLQAQLLRYLQGCTIVEIGSARQPLRHSIDAFNPVCCNDGHSSYFWASQPGVTVHTVDVDPASKRALDAAGLPNLHAYTDDGIGFLDRWSGPPIDLLFLDAWDVGVPFYAERHLEAFQAVTRGPGKLSARHIIGIDDTDMANGGKGQLLIPYLASLGYHQIADGRQTVFVNFELPQVPVRE